MARDVREALAPMRINTARPKPQQVAIVELIDPMELKFAQSNYGKFCEHVKRRMAYKLAEHVVEKCDVLIMPTYERMQAELKVSMELTINDASAYENWLPLEHRAGVREGVVQGRAALKKELPYGMEMDAFYE